MTPSDDDRAGDPRPRGWRPAERRIVIRTETSTRHLRVGAGAQIGMAAAFLALIGWGGFSTASWMTAELERDALTERLAAVETRFEQRIASLEADREATRARLTAENETTRQALEAERDLLRRDLAGHEQRLDALSEELSQRQMRLVAAAEAERGLSLALETLQAKLRDATARRDAAMTETAKMQAELQQSEQRLASMDSAEDEWASTTQAVSDALKEVAAARDAAMSDAKDAGAQLAALQESMAESRARREQVLGQLEDAVQVGLGALQDVFDRAGLNVDRLVEKVRKEYAGEGGPFIPAAYHGDASPLPGSEEARVASLMTGLERTALMRIAAQKLPLATPVHSAFRFTSGFGVRRDPINGRGRMHSGTDFASGRGTPIYATGDGVVVFSGWQSGYGNVVKIRHGFGFETVYGHMSKRRVQKGDRVASGDRIGDMGSTGRSTGTHLHYEVHIGGKPVNPMKYIEAARNVL